MDPDVEGGWVGSLERASTQRRGRPDNDSTAPALQLPSNKHTKDLSQPPSDPSTSLRSSSVERAKSKGKGRAKAPLALGHTNFHQQHQHIRIVSHDSVDSPAGPATPSPPSPLGSRPFYRSPHSASPSSRSFWQRAKEAVMVASPRLPFYSDADDSGFARSSTMARTLTPTRASPMASDQPAISFSGPAGLFSPNFSGASGIFASAAAGLGISSPTPKTPRLGHSHNLSGKFQSKRPLLYKEKSDDDFLRSPRPDGSMRKVSPTTPAGKTSLLRVPRSVLRLVSRRSRTFPLLILLLVFTLWAMGYARQSSVHDAEQAVSTSRMQRFLKASLPGVDLSVRDLNPMKWAQIRAGQVQMPFEAPAFDVFSHDPAGPNAEPGSVGSAAKRYASWEGGRADGRMLVKEGEPHPIPGLMQRAKQRWYALKNRQSRSFAEAVREYERRYGRMPPKGFDRWYAFAKYHDVQLIEWVLPG